MQRYHPCKGTVAVFKNDRKLYMQTCTIAGILSAVALVFSLFFTRALPALEIDSAIAQYASLGSLAITLVFGLIGNKIHGSRVYESDQRCGFIQNLFVRRQSWSDIDRKQFEAAERSFRERFGPRGGI